MGILDKLSSSLREKLDEELETLAQQDSPVRSKTAKTKPASITVNEVKARTREIIADAKDEALKIKQAADREASRVRDQAQEARRQLTKQEADLDRRLGALEEREKSAKKKDSSLEQELAAAEKAKTSLLTKLEKISGLTKQAAEKLVLEATEKKLASTVARKISEAEESIKVQAEEKAKQILVDAMQHGATDYVAEYTVSTVHLPDEEMKGRVIGREGRNIRAFEQVTGVEIELDESNDILISSFDPVRRAIAKRALEQLIRDRRIQPSRIEEIVKKTEREVEKIMFEEGQRLCHTLKVYRLHPDLMKLLGRFKFRFSYGQNMITHTLEETKIGINIAHQVGADINVVRLGCLLHDIGKVITEEDGTHVQLAVDLVKKYQLPDEVIACIAEHHEDKPFSSAESRIVWIADAISGSRPGARYEPHQEYLERMTQIEEIAKDFPGVKKVFAYQAGRDVRVMVKPEEVDDDKLRVLADKIARALEEKASYAGQIKVTCIRELRESEMTKAK